PGSSSVDVIRAADPHRPAFDELHRVERRLQRPGGAVDVALFVPADDDAASRLPQLLGDVGRCLLVLHADPARGRLPVPLAYFRQVARALDAPDTGFRVRWQLGHEPPY